MTDLVCRRGAPDVLQAAKILWTLIGSHSKCGPSGHSYECALAQEALNALGYLCPDATNAAVEGAREMGGLDCAKKPPTSPQVRNSRPQALTTVCERANQIGHADATLQQLINVGRWAGMAYYERHGSSPSSTREGARMVNVYGPDDFDLLDAAFEKMDEVPRHSPTGDRRCQWVSAHRGRGRCRAWARKHEKYCGVHKNTRQVTPLPPGSWTT